MDNILTIDKIEKYYGSKSSLTKAIDGISFEVEKGEFVAIMGASGSGKSTMMNILGCLDIPSEGHYYLDGKDVSRLNDHKLSEIRNQKIGFIFQGFNLIPGMSALENVELPLSYRRVPATKRKMIAKAALKQVGLEERMSHKPSEMSGGQQQRVAIARAIAARPSIILADEPTGNLDTRSGSEIMQILQELHQGGSTIVLITHDSGIAAMAQRTIRVSDGSIQPVAGLKTMQ